jgi:hypothetical protein
VSAEAPAGPLMESTVPGMHSELPPVVTARTAAVAGVTPAHVRTYLDRGLWTRMAPGLVLTRSGTPTRTDWLVAALIVGGDTAAVSGLDALRMAGVRAFSRVDTPLVLTRHRDSGAVGPVRLRWTRRPFTAWTTSPLDDRLPCSLIVTAARALSDVATLGVGPTSMRALVTEAAQRGLVTVEELVEELSTMRRNGSRSLRLAIEDVSDGAASIAEAKAVDHLRTAAVPPFELNVPVVVGGRIVAVLDILWRELRAVAEIDSVRHHGFGNDWDGTWERHNRLTALGLAIRHDKPARLGAAWAREVEGWLRARARELGVPFRTDPRVVRPGPDGPPPLKLP